MSIFDRFRKPVKYLLQSRKGTNFTTVIEYNASDFPTPPTIANLEGEITEPRKYHRILAIYPGGSTRQIDQKQGTRSTGTRSVDWDGIERGIDEAIEPFQRIGSIINKMNEAIKTITGGGLEPDDIRQIIREEMGGVGGGDFWAEVNPPGWTWFLHPYMRSAQKGIFQDIEDMIVGVGERLIPTLGSTTPTTPTTPTPTMSPNLFDDILNEEMSKIPKPSEPPAPEKTPSPEKTTKKKTTKKKGEEKAVD